MRQQLRLSSLKRYRCHLLCPQPTAFAWHKSYTHALPEGQIDCPDVGNLGPADLRHNRHCAGNFYNPCRRTLRIRGDWVSFRTRDLSLDKCPSDGRRNSPCSSSEMPHGWAFVRRNRRFRFAKRAKSACSRHCERHGRGRIPPETSNIGDQKNDLSRILPTDGSLQLLAECLIGDGRRWAHGCGSLGGPGGPSSSRSQ